MAKHILLVDDDDLMRRSLAFTLEQAGFTTMTSATAENALALVQRKVPDLILLDIGLPDMDGLEALRQIRQIAEVPVIFVTARRRELDEILGLELGADAYITKPFNADVLLAHIKAVLRRVDRGGNGFGKLAHEPLVVSNVTIDTVGHTVHVDGKEVSLAPRAFDLLVALASQPGQVLSTDDLLARVWGAEYLGEPQVVYVHIRWLREKLEVDPSHPKRILTVRGVGYKMVTN